MDIAKVTFNLGRVTAIGFVTEFPADATSVSLPYEPNPQGKVDVYIGHDGTIKHKPYPKD